jgi:predicted neuraminidase
MIARSIKVTSFVILLSTVSIGYSASPEPPYDGVIRKSTRSGLREAYLPVLFPSSHASNLQALGNGDLLCVWFSGSSEGKSNVSITMSRLPKGDQRWTKPVLLSQQLGRSAQNPVLFSAPDGKLWLFHTSQIADEGQKNSEVRTLSSKDNGHTWTAPKPLFGKPGAFVRHPLLFGLKKEWLLPMYYTPEDPTNGERHYSVLNISKDQGKTWTEYPMSDTQGLVQPSVVRLRDGRLLALFRSRYADWIHQSFSDDDGHSWTRPQKTQLPNNNSSFQLIRLQNGHLVLAFNNIQGGDQHEKILWGIPRSHLSVALSTDEGLSWSAVRDVQLAERSTPKEPRAGGEYSYPSILQTPDGKLRLTYTFLRKTIKYVEFTEEWIQQGTTNGLYRGSAR